jgi:poly(3-hydroxybutyrate) depolymerase
LTPSLPDSKKQDYIQKGAGHYGIFSGRKWRQEVAPTIENFVAKSMAPKRKSTKASPKRVVKK